MLSLDLVEQIAIEDNAMNDSNSSSAVSSPVYADLHYVKSFHFDLTKPCYCSTGELFGNCCGTQSLQRQSPRHLHIFKDFLSATDCKRFIRFAGKQKRSPLSVVAANKSKDKKTVHQPSSSRITQQIMLGKKQVQANQWFHSACLTKLKQFTHQEPNWFEMPHLLHYEPGGKYDIHSDAEHYDFENRQFYRFIDRDFSMLIYLNDNFTGGELNFPWLNYQYKPVAGDLVIFPSNHIFTHESLPIISGKKYALVSWGAFKGSARVRQPRTMLKAS